MSEKSADVESALLLAQGMVGVLVFLRVYGKIGVLAFH